MSMEDEKKPVVSFLQCLSVPDGRTFKVEVKSEPIEWPHNKDNDTASKTYTATISFKLDVYATPKKAFAEFINKIFGKGTWERNPYRIAYEFTLIK